MKELCEDKKYLIRYERTVIKEIQLMMVSIKVANKQVVF